jgi:prepilin-type N-terminal cleavage/methylation domain-containing protein/prepilin-type processing-associated H-X9-DG protein
MLRRSNKGFTLIELLVVVAIIGALIAILVPSLGKVRKRTKTLTCATNLRGLAQLYRLSLQQSPDNMITSGGHGGPGGAAWDYQLIGSQVQGQTVSEYYAKNGKANAVDKFRFCPETDSNRRGGRFTGSATSGWECNAGGGGGSQGSYEINGWILPATGSESGLFYNLRRLNDDTVVPIFADGIWHDFRPHDNDAAPRDVNVPSEALEGFAPRTISDVIVNRHDKKTNVVYWDGHVTTIKLEDVFNVRWNKQWKAPAPVKLNYNNY